MKNSLFQKSAYHQKNNRDNEFVAHQSGGRIKILNDEYLILTTGEYRSRHLAQDQNSVFGKVLKIDLKNSSHKIISIGHRNPQGLEINQNLIFITEHGPSGGDEINVINLNDNIEIKNYGWPISSYGEHYDKKDKNKYSKYPLHNSHEKYGFIEPLKYFTPSIGISEIIMIEENKYLFSSMRDRSLYYFDYDNVSRKITDIEKIFVGERIRDLAKVNNNTAIMFMEDTASIGFIDLDLIKEEFFK